MVYRVSKGKPFLNTVRHKNQYYRVQILPDPFTNFLKILPFLLFSPALFFPLSYLAPPLQILSSASISTS